MSKKLVPEKLTVKDLQAYFAEEPKAPPTMPARYVDQSHQTHWVDNVKVNDMPDGYKFDPRTGEPIPLSLEEESFNGNRDTIMEEGFGIMDHDSDSDLMGLNEAIDRRMSRRPGFDY
jgi:hypothetical protein